MSETYHDRSELAALIERHAVRDGVQPTAVPALYVARSFRPQRLIHAVYEPSLCVVAQGIKSVTFGGEDIRYDAEHFLLVSVSLPLVAQIVEASDERPLLALHIDLDPTLIAALLTEHDIAPVSSPTTVGALSVGALDALLADAITRLVRLLDTPQHIAALAPLIMRELCYLLLTGPEGARLRDFALANGQAYRIAKAIEHLRYRYQEPLRMEHLAKQVGMSVSGLHHHFKAVTAMSPLQSQKQVRLQEARQLMLGENMDAASAGSRVGYVSASQFNREYRRFFGAPPAQDVTRLRNSVV